MAYPNNFPATSLNDHTTNNAVVDGITVVVQELWNNLNAAMDALEAKVGKDASAVTTSHDYRIYRQGVQTVITEYAGGTTTGSTTVPYDDTVMQNTEGAEFMTQAITPTNASNILEIEVQFWFSSTANSRFFGSIFQDSTANALRSGVGFPSPDFAHPTLFRMTHRMTAGTTSETTFKFRAGQEAAHTITMNGVAGARILGGMIKSHIKVTEWKV